MIDNMTPEQEALMEVYRDKWLAIGLDTSPIDREAAKEAVIKAYECGGLKPPARFEFVGSPQEAKDKFGHEAPNIMSAFTYGNHDAGYLGYCEFMKDVLGVKNIESVEGLIEVGKTCGWVAVYDEVAIITERPSVIRRDERNLLHCDNGPAIEYPDGFSVYSWHGTRFPGEWLEEGVLTAKVALTEQNVELRRVACEILGWDKIVAELEPTIIDVDEDPQVGTLLEAEMEGMVANGKNFGKMRFLQVLCGTGRSFVLPVPPEMKTALEANAWTWNAPTDILKQLEVRT